MNDIINDIASQAMANSSVIASQNCNHNDYIEEETGLLYCGKCRTPKQTKVSLLGSERVVCCLCQCEYKKAEHNYIVRKAALIKNTNMNLCRIPDIFRSAYINDIKDEQKNLYASNYVCKFDLIFNQGLLIYGDVGTGKSYYAASIANELLKNGKSVIWFNVTDISSIGKISDSEEREAYIRSITEPDVVILDDLGAERSTEYAAEKVHEFIDYRASVRKPMIITTNIELQAMRQVTDIRYKRTYDRIFQCCFPIEFRGISYRQLQAKENFDRMTQILGGE